MFRKGEHVWVVLLTSVYDGAVTQDQQAGDHGVLVDYSDLPQTSWLDESWLFRSAAEASRVLANAGSGTDRMTTWAEWLLQEERYSMDDYLAAQFVMSDEYRQHVARIQQEHARRKALDALERFA